MADPATTVLENKGYCPTCDQSVLFSASETWLRDFYTCSNCQSIPRERAIMLCIERFFPAWKTFHIHESSPGTRGASVKLKNQCSNYVGSHYFEGFSKGDRHPSGWLNEDLEAQTFADESFDLVVTQDVMEHIFQPEKAFAEIARTLKAGGAHVFTVPLVLKDNPSRPRARKTPAGNIEYLLEPEYHGNPISEKGSLVTWDWGYDLCEYIYQWSNLISTIVYIDDLHHGIRAEYIEVIISRKRPA